MNENLKKARNKKGYTQQEMANFIGYTSKSGYANIELGYVTPSVNTAIKISDILDADVKDLFFECDVHESRKQSDKAV